MVILGDGHSKRWSFQANCEVGVNARLMPAVVIGSHRFLKLIRGPYV